MKKRILIVDDELDFTDLLQRMLCDQYDVLTANDGNSALALISKESIDAMLLDLELPDISGIDVLERLNKNSCEIATVVVSGTGDISAAVKAMQLGAYTYIEKPPDYEEVKMVVKKILECQDMKNEVNYLRSEVAQNRLNFGSIIGKSKNLIEIFDTVDKASKTDATVLISGESGTGKELIAHAIHDNSYRKDKNFVVVSCPNLPTELMESELFDHEKGAFTGAITKQTGKFEVANGGTIFLDEIGELPPTMQAKLLRVIQEKEFSLVGGEKIVKVDVRIIAATNRLLKDEIKNGNFREDLYFRLNVIPLTLPPLRQRTDDIPVLVMFFIEHFQKELHCKTSKFSSNSIEILQRYDWPGNIRELRNVIERVLSLYGDVETITPDFLPVELVKTDSNADVKMFELSKIDSLESATSLIEKDLIIQALQQSNGNLSKAARLLQIDRWKLRHKLEKLNIEETVETPSSNEQ